MSTKGKAVVSITAIIQEARASKSSSKEEPFQTGKTYNQYVFRGKDVTGEKFAHAVANPGRGWVDLPEAEDAVICYKSLASAIAATAQEQVARQVEGAYFAWLDAVPLEEQVANGTKGFGAHDRAFEVAMTPEITEMLAASASFSGEDHIGFFKGKTERRKLERGAYQALHDPKLAEVIEALRSQD